jgi:hypothetical protein
MDILVFVFSPEIQLDIRHMAFEQSEGTYMAFYEFKGQCK